MDNAIFKQIFTDCAYVRTGGSPEELACAQYIQQRCANMGLNARLEQFNVEMARVLEAQLWCDGVQIPCKGYLCAGNGDVEAPVYYLTGTDAYNLAQCRGKIVLTDMLMSYWVYNDILKSGALGFITYTGEIRVNTADLEQKELRSYVRGDTSLPGVNIHSRDAVALVQKGVKNARIVLKQNMWQGTSQNVVLDLPGQTEETIVFSAHYDSTPLSVGVYDNMSGAAALLAIAEYFVQNPHRMRLRFVWCGSEERGLLGSKAYCAAHKEELENIMLNINLDMVGCAMGQRACICTAEERVVHYVQYLADELGTPITARQDIHSSDSTPFADAGIPAVSFSRRAPERTATIHDRFDTIEVMSMERMQQDVWFICRFAQRMANAAKMPVARTIPENMKNKLDEYLNRKRPAR